MCVLFVVTLVDVVAVCPEKEPGMLVGLELLNNIGDDDDVNGVDDDDDDDDDDEVMGVFVKMGKGCGV